MSDYNIRCIEKAIDEYREKYGWETTTIVESGKIVPVFRDIDVVVYMSNRFWMQCMRGISGPVSDVAMEFLYSYNRMNPNDGNQTIAGCKVYRVLSENHPQFAIREEK